MLSENTITKNIPIKVTLTKEEIKLLMCACDLIIQQFGENEELEEISEKLYSYLIKK